MNGAPRACSVFFWLEHCYFLGANHAGAMLESRESRNHRMAGVLRGWLFYCAGARCSGSSSRARWCSRGRRRGASPGMPSPGPTTRTDSCSAAPAAPPLDGAPPAAGLPARRPELPFPVAVLQRGGFGGGESESSVPEREHEQGGGHHARRQPRRGRTRLGGGQLGAPNFC